MGSFEAAIADGKDLIEQNDSAAAKQYVKRMTGVLDGVVQNPKSGLHMFKGRVNGMPAYTSQEIFEDVKTIMAKIQLIIESDQRKLDEKYGTASLTAHIERCKAMLADEDATDSDAEQMCYEMASIYSAKVKGFTNELSVYPICDGCGIYPKRDLAFVAEKLSSHRDDIIRDFNKSRASGPMVHVEQTQSNQQTVSVAVRFEQTIEQIDALDDSILSDDEKSELKKLLFDVREGQKKGKVRFLKAAKVVADWVFDKGVEALPIVFSYIAQVAQSLV